MLITKKAGIEVSFVLRKKRREREREREGKRERGHSKDQRVQGW